MYEKNKEIANNLIDIIENEINNFSYDNTNDLSYLFPFFDTLVSVLSGQNNLLFKLYSDFSNIHDILRNILRNKPDDMNKNQLSRFKIMNNIMNKMESTMLRIYYDNPTEYNPNKEEFIHYLIFESKNIERINASIEKFPHIVNVVDKNDIPLIERVIDAYLNSLDKYLSSTNLTKIDDLLYYDKVLEIMTNSDKIKISILEEKQLLKKINKYFKSKKYKNEKQKEKLSFFINNIICLITNKQIDNTLEYINYKYDINDKFNEAHILEAKSIYSSKKNIEFDNGGRKIYTFDGENACEIDDGLSVSYKDGIYEFGVHIADPTSYISRNSIINDEASRRTTSIYMDDECIPMYPLLLSKDLMGLNEGKITHAMNYYFKIDELTGEVFDFKIVNEPINITKNLTYDYLDGVLIHGSNNEELENTLINLRKVSDILKSKYQMIDLYTSINDEKMTPAREIVQNSMIYTNYAVPKLFGELALPFIYRSHKIDEEKLKKLEDLETRLRTNINTTSMAKIIKSMKGLYPRAYYTPNNEGHFGLSLDYYSHVTSPLRRYADIVANICIKKFILGKYNKDDIKRMNEYIEEISSNINEKRRSIEDYEIEYMKKKHTI